MIMRLSLRDINALYKAWLSTVTHRNIDRLLMLFDDLPTLFRNKTASEDKLNTEQNRNRLPVHKREAGMDQRGNPEIRKVV